MRNDGSNETRYLHTDHLGSLAVVTSVTGAVVESLSYDAFGKRRYPNGQSDPSNLLGSLTTKYGFTEQEHLDGVDLIHMNGRVYDPNLAALPELIRISSFRISPRVSTAIAMY